MARDITGKLTDQYQPKLDSIFENRQGKTVAEVAGEIRRACPELQPSTGPNGFNEWAETILGGQRIKLTAGDPTGL